MKLIALLVTLVASGAAEKVVIGNVVEMNGDLMPEVTTIDKASLTTELHNPVTDIFEDYNTGFEAWRSNLGHNDIICVIRPLEGGIGANAQTAEEQAAKDGAGTVQRVQWTEQVAVPAAELKQKVGEKISQFCGSRPLMKFIPSKKMVRGFWSKLWKGVKKAVAVAAKLCLKYCKDL